MKLSRLLDDTSNLLSVRFRNKVISLISQSSACSSKSLSPASIKSALPVALKPQVLISGSFVRKCKIKSSSSLANAKCQKASPNSCIPSKVEGGASEGAKIVISAKACSLSKSTESVLYFISLPTISLFKGLSLIPTPSLGLAEFCANSKALS